MLLNQKLSKEIADICSEFEIEAVRKNVNQPFVFLVKTGPLKLDLKIANNYDRKTEIVTFGAITNQTYTLELWLKIYLKEYKTIKDH